MRNKFTNFFVSIYEKLFKIDDTPQRVALGFGLGVFLGIFPGTGPVAAIFLAVLFRLNRAAALIGSLLTNTWSSIIVFFLAFQLGSLVMGEKWQDITRDWNSFQSSFRWADLFKFSTLKIILPVIIGYILIGLLLGFLTYLITLAIIKKVKKAR